MSITACVGGMHHLGDYLHCKRFIIDKRVESRKLFSGHVCCQSGGHSYGMGGEGGPYGSPHLIWLQVS